MADAENVVAPNYWGWWAGYNEEYCTVGPCDSREEVIAAAQEEAMNEFQDADGVWKVSFFICEAEQRPLRLADWFDVGFLLERAEEALSDSDRVGCDGDEGPWFKATAEQESDLQKRIASACDEWQAHDNGRWSNVEDGEGPVLAAADLGLAPMQEATP